MRTLQSRIEIIYVNYVKKQQRPQRLKKFFTMSAIFQKKKNENSNLGRSKRVYLFTKKILLQYHKDCKRKQNSFNSSHTSTATSNWCQWELKFSWETFSNVMRYTNFEAAKEILFLFIIKFVCHRLINLTIGSEWNSEIK